jgi:hypothetical protein
MLPQIDAAALEGALLLWQDQMLGASQDKLVIVDGKTLCAAARFFVGSGTQR